MEQNTISVSDNFFKRFIEVRSEIDFFIKLVNLGILDPTNFYINSLYHVAVKIDVIFHKNDLEEKDLLAVFDLYRKFNLILFNLYKSLRKEA